MLSVSLEVVDHLNNIQHGRYNKVKNKLLRSYARFVKNHLESVV